MPHLKYLLSLILLAATALVLSSAASGSGQIAPKIKVTITGPKAIVLGTSYKYTLTVKNTSSVNLGTMKLRLTPAEFIVGSSSPYKKMMVEWRPRHTAEWVRSNFKAGAVYTVHLVLVTRPNQTSSVNNTSQLIGEVFGVNPAAYATVLYQRTWTSSSGG